MQQSKEKEEGGFKWYHWAVLGTIGVVGLAVVGKLLSNKGSKNSNNDEVDDDEVVGTGAFEDSDDDEIIQPNDEKQMEQKQQATGDWEVLISRAEVLKQQGNFVAADNCFRKAYDIMKKSLDPSHAYIGLLFASWAPVLTFLKKFTLAEQYLEQALTIFGKDQNNEMLPPEQLVEIYANLGEIYIKTKKYDKAKTYLQLSIDKAEDKDMNPNVGVSKMNMAEVLVHEKKYNAAITNCNEAIQIFKQHLPPNHPIMLQTELKIMTIHVERGDVKAADAKFEEIIEQQKKSTDPQSLTTVALFLQQRASINYEFELYDKAKQFYEECIEMLSNNRMAKHVQNELSCLYRTIGNVEKADNILAEVRKDVEKLPTSPVSISKFFQVMNMQQFTVTYTEKKDNKKPWPVWANYKLILQIKRNPKDKTPKLSVGNVVKLVLTNYDNPEENVLVEGSDNSASRIVLTEKLLSGPNAEDRRASLCVNAIKPVEGVYLAIVKVYENEEQEQLDQPIEFGVLKQLSVSRIDTNKITVAELKDIQKKQSEQRQFMNYAGLGN